LPFADPGRHADRRTRPNTAASFVTCRVCGTSVRLEGRKIEQGRDYATVPCTQCSALVPIRRTDALHAIQEELHEHLTGARVGRGVFDRWRRPR
jgi:hypothetical protein